MENKFERISKPLDNQWYPELVKHGSFECHEYLDGDTTHRQKERQKFQAGEIENPTLDYPNLNDDALKRKESFLLQLKDEIVTTSTENRAHTDKMEAVKQTYRWRLNEKIAEIRLLMATNSNNHNRFQKYSHFIYGKPSTKVFSYTARSLQKSVANHLNSDNKDIRTAAENLEPLLPNTEEVPETEIALPDEDTVNFVRNETLKELGYLIDIPEDTSIIDQNVVRRSFETALNRLGSTDWKVVTNPNKSIISANQETKEINIPPENIILERHLTPHDLKGLILHEIGTHVARRERGKSSPLSLLGLGLPRYLGDEGVASVRQQVMDENFEDFAHLDRHLAISLAEGLDGQPRDFRQVYDIMYLYYRYKKLIHGQSLSTANKDAQTEAWMRCVRTFRGTDCKTPGVAFTKDIIYAEGNIGVWELIQQNPRKMKWFNEGKYDPTNPDHEWILTKLGITDEDLNAVQND